MYKRLIIDGTNHIAGKLAAFVAKKLLQGYHVTIVCIENVVFSGNLHRHIGKYKSFKEKRAPYNPQRGALHWSVPSMYFKRKLLRGMISYKTKKGAEALSNLECYETIPKEFENVERMVVPKALMEVTNKPDRGFCTLGELLSKFGWNHKDITKKYTADLLERERKFREEQEKKNSEINKLIKDKSFINEVDKRLKEFA